MYPQPPVAELNNRMAKVQMVPKYELMYEEARCGREGFMMRVTCPLTPFGKPLIAYSKYCETPKEAKHSAALTFMNKYLRIKNYVEYSLPEAYQLRVEEERIYYQELEELETICFQNYLDQPMFCDVSAEGPQHCLTWTIECYVSDLVTEGKGKRKVQARIQATRRMIEMLTDEAGSHYENVDSLESTVPPHEHEIVSSSDDAKGYQPNDQDRVFDQKKSHPNPPDVHAASGVSLSEAHRASRNLNTAETLLRWLNLLKASEIKESQHDSGTNLKPKDLDEDPQREISFTKISSPCRNNGASNRVDGGVESSSTPNAPRKLTRLQAVSRINRTLRAFERELNDNILGALVHTNLPHRATVRILCQEYVVFIKQDSPPMIFEEHYECFDQSIRVACLTRLLLDLVDHITKG